MSTQVEVPQAPVAELTMLGAPGPSTSAAPERPARISPKKAQEAAIVTASEYGTTTVGAWITQEGCRQGVEAGMLQVRTKLKQRSAGHAVPPVMQKKMKESCESEIPNVEFDDLE